MVAEPRLIGVTLPERARIREVGPRDGFQNEPEVIATDDKVALVELLAASGLERIEVTSFVRADVIPQLADGAEVLQRISVPDEVSLGVLVPNERGLDRALELRDRFHEVNVFMSASETHNRKNVNRSIAESLTGLEAVLGRAREAGLRCEAVISVAFGCPYEGHVEPQTVFSIARRLAGAGAQEIGFGDTTGMANPRQVREFFAAAFAALPGLELTAHFHNTRGQGLANVLAALETGVESFEFQLRRARRLSRAAWGDRQRRDGGRSLDARRDGRAHGRLARAPAPGRTPCTGGPRPSAWQPPAHGRPGGLARVSGRPDGRHLREDVEALAALGRDSAGAGERAAAAWVAAGCGTVECRRSASSRCAARDRTAGRTRRTRRRAWSPRVPAAAPARCSRWRPSHPSSSTAAAARRGCAGCCPEPRART
jgi:hydroxymethylglutaryl-CoA lyase